MGEITIPDALGRGMKLTAMPKRIVIIGTALFMIADAACLFTGAGRCPPTGSGPTWEPRRYWRGPVWMIVDWFLMEGLQRYGYDDLARIIRQDTLSLVKTHGFREYYHACDGSGCGSVNFSWSVSLILELLMALPAQENSHTGRPGNCADRRRRR